ncbi:hypothetical protein N7539_000108 [Penicillium diatomitis]|uniref:Uncharacterized protein n=1 Tax=Penicillium diatomitis TaxID=2819901 RepID=A0A9X0C1W7_9EURO|nr:uncharacterized protein N7539_000108 [Penicillium diatomitis]KAJ5494992.1 hypothetical protein N7539_000108 [Penicillium diatomitis]
MPFPLFHPGLYLVAACTAFFWRFLNRDYGIFLKKCSIAKQHAIPVFPRINGAEDAMGVPHREEPSISSLPSPAHSPGDKRHKKEFRLHWCASSSVGTMGVQSASLLRDDPSSPVAGVEAVASLANHAYSVSLGANHYMFLLQGR